MNTETMHSRRVAVAVDQTAAFSLGSNDDSPPSSVVDLGSASGAYLSYAQAVRLILHVDDDVHLISVKCKVPGAVLPMPSVLSPSDREIFCSADTAKDEEERVSTLLRDAARSDIFNNFHPTVHVLEPVGGASGAGESLVSFCKSNSIDLLLLGPVRTSGKVSGMLRSALGFGSVSEYSLHHLDIPVCIFHSGVSFGVEGSEEKCRGRAGQVVDNNYDDTQKTEKRNKKVLVCVDSLNGDAASLVTWMMKNVYKRGTEVHILSCSLKAPYDIIPEDSMCAMPLYSEEEQAQDDALHHMAESAVEVARGVAVDLGAQEELVSTQVVNCKGSDASDIVKAIYGCSECGFDLVVIGRRQQTTVGRILNGWLGQGSVSDSLTKKRTAPVVVCPQTCGPTS
jgi:nucleotide-binding universal stress UspA family protein